MSALNFYTRGGQLALHKFHMFKQICYITFLISFCVGLMTFGILLFNDTTPYQRYLYREHLHAEFMVNMSQNDPSKITQEFKYPSGVVREVKSEYLLKDPQIVRQIETIERIVYKNLWNSLWAALITVLPLIGFFIYRGYVKSKKKLERGNQIISSGQLKGVLKRTNQASDLHLDNLPLAKDKETSHILITGTTSSGKTNCFHTLLPQIRTRPNRALVVDTTGEFVSKYYREGQDFLLNPFDARSQSWSPWADCLTESHYDALASAIVPKSTAHDKFWENAGKVLFSSALKELAHQRHTDIQKLYHILVKADLNEFSKFFQNTDASPYTHPEGEKMTLSIRATLANHLQGFKYLKSIDTGFSLRKWIENEKAHRDQWLFLSARPDQRETLLPLITGWLDTAINALMTLSPAPKRRLWFVIDELPSLQRLPSLETAMAESRKYGGCTLAGIQSFPQLSTLYGQHQAQSILDLFNTKIFFRNTDPNTTAWISKVLGEAELTEQQENVSYGANTIRDGVSLSPQTRTKPLVLPSEVASLKDLEAFVKLPGFLPACKLQMKYKDVPGIASGFEPLSKIELKKRLYGIAESVD